MLLLLNVLTGPCILEGELSLNLSSFDCYVCTKSDEIEFSYTYFLTYFSYDSPIVATVVTKESICCDGPTVGDCPYVTDMQGSRPEAMIVATIRARPFGVAV